jgi:DNA-binding transcriptional regulator YdaS (Cro superfamily)
MLSTMNLKDWIGLERGRAAALARRLDISHVYLSHMASGARQVPVRLAPVIERETGEQVTRRELRPNDWQSIWPELGKPQEQQHAA